MMKVKELIMPASLLLLLEVYLKLCQGRPSDFPALAFANSFLKSALVMFLKQKISDVDVM
jgi:hypothetical protein